MHILFVICNKEEFIIIYIVSLFSYQQKVCDIAYRFYLKVFESLKVDFTSILHSILQYHVVYFQVNCSCCKAQKDCDQLLTISTTEHRRKSIKR